MRLPYDFHRVWTSACDNIPMAVPPIAPTPLSGPPEPPLGRTRLLVLVVLGALLALCFAFVMLTRDVMRDLPTVSRQGTSAADIADRNNIVDISPWRTAQALAPWAVTAEET